MFKNSKNKIYIIGSIPNKINVETILRFSKAERELQEYSVEIVNPIRNLTDPNLSRELAHKKNISNLLESSAVYILSEPYSTIKLVPELKLSFLLNLIVIHQKPIYEEAIKD